MAFSLSDSYQYSRLGHPDQLQKCKLFSNPICPLVAEDQQPYHPQGRGKIERFNRSIKEKICLMVYCSPGELRKALDEAIATYNGTPHEALNNVSPNDVYAGRKEVVLQRRQEKKRLTLERRRQYNLNTKKEHPDQHQDVN
jgi:transposase InsO family protein